MFLKTPSFIINIDAVDKIEIDDCNYDSIIFNKITSGEIPEQIIAFIDFDDYSADAFGGNWQEYDHKDRRRVARMMATIVFERISLAIKNNERMLELTEDYFQDVLAKSERAVTSEYDDE